MTHAVTTPPSAFTALLAAYVTGAVGDAVMAGFDDLFAEADASAAERLAFARFYLDALEAGEDADAFPTALEVPGILNVVRA
ncbi:hypothetical protein [Rubrivirga sp. IMCC43871]|uniref:hypothetical protein n=1 Tax=Rubrivirga sp. IMCC43871 TaxID=3391575 RepID=UPI00399038A6